MSLPAGLLRPSVLASAALHVAAVVGLAWGTGTPAGRRGAELPGIATVEATFAAAEEVDPSAPPLEAEPDVVAPETPAPREVVPPAVDRPLVDVLPEDVPPSVDSLAGTIIVAPARDARVRSRRPKEVAPAPPSRPALSATASTPPRALASNPPPAYPADAVARGWQGTALVLVVVRADGTVASASLARTSGHPLLDEAALAAVRGWRYAPAVRDGAPVGDRVLQPVEFRLRAGS